MPTMLQSGDALKAVPSIITPNLTDEEAAELLDAINDVRAGDKEFYVVVTNKKVTKSRKRLPERNYVPHPALAPHAHKGWLVAANTNKKGEVYLHILDEARRRPEQDENHHHTRVTMKGILSFEIQKVRSGPLAAVWFPERLYKPENGPREPAQDASQEAPNPDLAFIYDPRFLRAQAALLRAHAVIQQAQAMQEMADYLEAVKNT